MSVSAEDVLRAKEKEWSDTLREGCAQSASAAAKTKVRMFLGDNLTDSFTNTDYLGKHRTKNDDIRNCTDGSYVVKFLSDPRIESVTVDGDTAVVVGEDDIFSEFNKDPVSGTFTWTDTWVNHGGKWQCAAHHGSKVAPLRFVRERDEEA